MWCGILECPSSPNYINYVGFFIILSERGELEQILMDMPFDEIVFKEFSEECLNAMLEKLSIHAPEEIREQIVAHKRALETIKELKGKII